MKTPTIMNIMINVYTYEFGFYLVPSPGSMMRVQSSPMTKSTIKLSGNLAELSY
jgi:hypothetical protein